MHENSLHVKILFTIGVVESSSPGHDDDEDAPLLLDIRSVDKEIDSLYNPTAHVKRHNTSQGNEGLQ